MRTLLIDNYDSFTYNLFHLLASVNGEPPIAVKNDEDWQEIQKIEFDNIVISPGPGRPDQQRDFGISRRAILEAHCPVLGVCLGHQGVGLAFGAKLIPAPELMHGRQSLIRHAGDELFAGIPSPFLAVRYHSWVLDPKLPPSLRATAWTDDGTLMALRHVNLPLFGVQFHPESIESRYGRELLENFRNISLPFRKTSLRPVPRCAVRRHSTTHWKVQFRELNLLPDAERLFVENFAQSESAFWLDSSRVTPGLSRFSFLGDFSGPHAHWLGEAPLEEISRRVRDSNISPTSLPFDFQGGYIGYLGYERNAAFGFVSRFVALDHQERKTFLVELTPQEAALDPSWLDGMETKVIQAEKAGPLPEPEPLELPAPAFNLRTSKADYLVAIQKCLDAIRLGESYEICLTTQILAQAPVAPLLVYRFLRRLNPAPYGAFLKLPGVHILSSSPERFLKVNAERMMEAKPIKGTLPRGKTTQQDEELKLALSSDEKFRSENLMIVDLLRNDLGSVAEPGSVCVPKLMEVETYSTVHQLVSTVQARLLPDLTAADAVRASFPGGSMTGAPKLRSMEIIQRLESGPRGIYSGALGFFGLNGTCDLSIVIRTLIENSGHWSIGTGGAILALSDPEAEFAEALLKAAAPMDALTMACFKLESGKKS
jgi:para-aminobenzoate synthetase